MNQGENQESRHVESCGADSSLPAWGVIGALLRSSRDAVAITDLDGNVLLANAAVVEASPSVSPQGRPWRSLWPQETRAQIDRLIAHARMGHPAITTVYALTPNGAPCWRHVSASPVLDDAGAVTHICCQFYTLGGHPSPQDALSRQLTDYKAALALLGEQLKAETSRLSDSRRQVSQSEKVKLLGQFVGGVVHDINNVLAVMTSASRLLRKYSLSEQALSVIDHADDAVERGARLLRQLLDFSRTASEEPEIVHLERLLGQDAALLRHLAGQTVVIGFDFPNEVWPVLTPPGKLQAVVFNLVANARDAMPEGGRLVLRVANCYASERPLGLSPRDYVALTVSDTGKGMTPEVLARAGEPFFTTKSAGKGTGLGLASAFELAEQCGGRVGIESAPGEGCAITLHLPRAALKGEIGDDCDPLLNSHLHGGATILLLENEEAVRRHVGNLLRSLNYTVIEAASPQQALAATMAPIRIDLIIANLDLAKGPAFDLLAGADQHVARIPKLFLAGAHGTPAPSHEAVLWKPIAEPLLAGSVLAKLGWIPDAVLAPDKPKGADRIRDRIRNPAIRELYETWRRILDERGLPTPSDMGDCDAGLKDNRYLLEVIGSDEEPAFRFEKVGSALIERLGRPLEGEILRASDHDVLGSITRAFQRCLKGSAYFDYSRISLGGGEMLLFERLLLPVSNNKICITHLFGVATFDDVRPSTE